MQWANLLGAPAVLEGKVLLLKPDEGRPSCIFRAHCAMTPHW